MILKAQGIHKSYKIAGNTLDVLKGIDLSIEAGEVVAVAGPSGAGKSTLLHILGGLDKPSDGQVELDGQDIYTLNDPKRAKLRNEKVGFVFQFYHLLPEFTALENVCLPLLINEDKSQIKVFEDRGRDLLKQVGLEERTLHKPSQLSGGEQQRVSIARALVNQPNIILCDEPTGNLDSKSESEIVELLIELNKKNKQTLVIVTHDEGIAKLAHRTIRIKDGQLV